MWKITRDYINDPAHKETGIQTFDFDPEKATCKFRLLDDDGVVYYHGVADTNNDDKAFEPLDFYLYHSGCTQIQFQNPTNKKWETL